MCSPLAPLHALAIVGMVFAFIVLALYDGKLLSHFEQKHPEVWADLGRRKVMFAEGECRPLPCICICYMASTKNSRMRSSTPWFSEPGCGLYFVSAAV
jgi:hypothetical protein